MWPRSFIVLVGALIGAFASAPTFAAGPFGTIQVGNWKGGAYIKDTDKSFSHCVALAPYVSGTSILIGQEASGAWLLGFANSAWKLTKGESIPVDITFDGQAQFHFFATAIEPTFMNMVLPATSALEQLRKATMMSVVAKGQVLQFSLTATSQLLPMIANCVTRTKAVGVANAGDFSVLPAKPVASANSKPDAPRSSAGAAAAKSAKTEASGTGFVVSTSGHVVTNNHVIAACTGDITGNLNGGSAMKMRLVSTDETNDLALLQAPTNFNEIAMIRATPIHSGDAIVAIGYPYHGLLTSDFTVTTGIVSSLSGILNDTRYLQISAPVQPGNSGGPLFDAGGRVVGVVAAKFNALKFAKLSGGNIPENMNFAIKTGAVRDFLDNSVVPYQTAEPGAELKTADVASNARAYTMLISCASNGKE
jgi:S1-C subfamily serine protease